MKKITILIILIIIIGFGVYYFASQKSEEVTSNQPGSTPSTETTEVAEETNLLTLKIYTSPENYSDYDIAIARTCSSDELIIKEITIPHTSMPLTTTIQKAFDTFNANLSQTYGRSEFDKAEVKNGTAYIYFNGNPIMGESIEWRCMPADFANIIIETAKQFPTVNNVRLYNYGNFIPTRLYYNGCLFSEKGPDDGPISPECDPRIE